MLIFNLLNKSLKLTSYLKHLRPFWGHQIFEGWHWFYTCILSVSFLLKTKIDNHILSIFWKKIYVERSSVLQWCLVPTLLLLNIWSNKWAEVFLLTLFKKMVKKNREHVFLFQLTLTININPINQSINQSEFITINEYIQSVIVTSNC